MTRSEGRPARRLGFKARPHPEASGVGQADTGGPRPRAVPAPTAALQSYHLQHLRAGCGTAPATSSAGHPARRGTLPPGASVCGTWWVGISLCGPPAGRHLSKADTSRVPRSPVVHTSGWAPCRHRAHATSPPSWPRLTQPERDGSLHPVSQAPLQVETDPASATFLIFENSTTDKSADGDRYLYIKQPRTSKRSLW